MTEPTASTSEPAINVEQSKDWFVRPVPKQNWAFIAIAVIVLSAALTAGWEIYWRGRGFEAGDFKDNKAIWAQERRKATGDATVLIGDSRMLFDIDLDVWEEMKGVRPIQLSLAGTSPRIVLTDLANDPDFHGTVFMHYLGPLMLTGSGGVGEAAVAYAKKQTWSERWDHDLAIPLENTFAFVDEVTRPKQMFFYADFPVRPGMIPRHFPWKLQHTGRDRNTHMWRQIEVDPVLTEEAKKTWIGMSAPPPPGTPPPPPLPGQAAPGPPPPDWRPTPIVRPTEPIPGAPMENLPPVAFPSFLTDAAIAEVKANIDKIRARGGEVVLARFPYDGFFKIEDVVFPTSQTWDRILEETDSAGVSWHDHAELQGFQLVEYSHLSASEATRFTRAVIPLLYEAYAAKKAARPK